MIIPYRGYGTTTKLFLRGHVLDDRLLYDSRHDDKRKKNFLAMLSRYVSEGIPDIRVEICFQGQEHVVVTDKDGLFEAEINLETPAKPGWQKVTYQVLDEIVEKQEPLENEGEVLINDGNNQFAIISDVDDTILISHATQALKKFRLILTKNSKTRLPFVGVASFYKALQTGNPSDKNNPTFYVSSSEWNLYDFLEDFCDVRNIPKGPFLLQELKTSLWKLMKSGGGTHSHKKDKVLHLMEVYPDQKFILIGDSGQRDAELYQSIAEQYPDRILSIYIRDVSKEKHTEKVNALASTLNENIDMLLVSDSFTAAKHAFENGYITAAELQNVQSEFEAQEVKPKTLVGQTIGSTNES